MFTGHITVRDAFADDEKNQVTNSTGVQFKEQFFRRQSLDSPFLSAELLDFQQIANRGGLTWAIPQIANKLNKFLRDSGGIPVAGTSSAIVAIVEVRWQWLSLPIVTWIIGTGFFIMTVRVCRGDQLLWKTSSLPLIYHGFDAGDLEAIGTTGTHTERVSGMESLAVNLHARFRKDSLDGQLRLSKL
ncbi:hypothetical protein E0Z10_g9390 [Xylaria hypoxylon]|uniref:Uncharacterized protein n=1 Tax=Xylaria hypoxylon TaxID=37992 RepID=A0A4Z0YSC7_9PEZI|nr:hypothetical protein E0Z10_g9390 [Xylaria hypoxylon]